MKKEVRLYNVLFPIWLFWLWPSLAWLIILPANFVLDSLVLCLSMKWNGVGNKFQIWKQSIAKIWVVGFVSDLIGAALAFGLMVLIDAVGLPWDTIHFPGTMLLSVPGVMLAGVLIYHCNKRFSFVHCELDAEQIRKLCLTLAVFTAPYAMLIPLYG